ncbi:MAG TPA: V-type ATP synthase subunit C [Clostridiales bacterium]|jgi:V/A-type H+-transporting ATPase subunit C|nr:V-type ATP synthase subunit C [Clostridiaceae bacterium]HOJ81226.1 V-type ATP synthase subunit C [Clostridiales bacterium]HOL92360.1 V-type ATP synthase subunit C [Clostridiales bacterium]HPP36186.1 V-type ATP synthase subunit C [Clostridiales bacterium]HPV01455.1 V-type ATP synthase subunit C [Clostridiales bacterium]
MLRINEGDYSYASGLIRAKETKLLTDSQYARMLDASSAEEAYKVLTDAGYGLGSGSTHSVFAFEQLLADEMKKCFMLLEEIAPKADVIRIFQKRYDYFNIKVLLKAELSGQDIPPILADTGTIGSDSITRMIRERDYSGLTPSMADAVTQVYDVFARMQDPQVVDLILDKASYQEFVADIRNIESPFLQELSDLIVDMTNIRMFIRSRSLDKTWDFIMKLLIDGGTLDRDVYYRNSDKPVDSFVEDIRKSRYGDAVRKGLDLVKSGKNSSGLEKALDDLLMSYIRSAKLVTIGVEPLIAYLFAKETEIRNARMIMTGKINNLPPDMIRERLRESYV